MRRLLLLLLFLPRPAPACECARQMLRVWPQTSDAAPLNTHVTVIVPSQAVPANTRPDDLQLVWRERDSRKHPVVDADRDVVVVGDETVIELTPKKPLTAGIRYEVLLQMPGKLPAVLTVFTTGKVADTTSPTWEGVKQGRWLKRPGDCSTGLPFAEVALGKASDDLTAAGSLLYAVWVADALGKIDYRDAPVSIVSDLSGLIDLGDPSKCLPANFAFPDKAKKVRIGVRPVDLAGNMGDASELDVDLTTLVK